MVPRLVVTGVLGRMGSLIARSASQGGFELVAGVERPGARLPSRSLSALVPGVQDWGQVHDSLDAALAAAPADVVVDFTSPEASVEHAKVCAARKVALVVGTTGFDAAGKAALQEAAKAAPMVVAPNMSVGVNLVIELAAFLAQRLGPDFDVDVLEAHHRMKKDSPSGTALRLAEEIAKATGRGPESIRKARVGDLGPRDRAEIGVQALRGGDVVGEHTVFFFGEGERVELTHRASSRDQFARGALRAARWLPGRAPGLYSMADVLR